MPRVCPRCNSSFNDRWTCPTCNVRLLPSGSAIYELSSTPFPTPEANWQQTVLGRGIVGLLFSQGVYYGLWQLCSTFVMASGSDSLIKSWRASPPEGGVWYLLLILQALSLLLGGTLAGAGQRRGVLLGLALGLVNSLIFLTTEWTVRAQTGGDAVTGQELVGQASFQILCGAVGGFLGSVIWKPATPILGPVGDTPPPPLRRTALGGARRFFRPFSGPVAWTRVAIGCIIAILGSYWSGFVLQYMLEMGHGEISVNSQYHAKFVTWEFSVLIMLVGAAFSGSNTKNGLKQGLIVGLVTSIAVILFYTRLERFEVPQTILFIYFIPLKPDLPDAWPVVLMTLYTVLPLGILGGWFGGQLLPPLLRTQRRKRVTQVTTGP